MHFSQSTVIALVAALSQVSAHGVITSIQGANGVTMAGLSVIDGTPRDCSTPGCGSEEDTSIIRNGGSPLGRTKGAGDVDAASAIATFLGTTAPAGTTQNNARGIGGRKARRTGVEARGLLSGLLSGLTGQNQGGGLLSGLTGQNQGGNANANGNGADAEGTKTPPGTTENGVAQNAGKGATSGLPTPDANGVITMTLHQVNQDGAGPFVAAIDPTSGGTDESAFQTAQVTQNVPGFGIGGLSGARTTDFTVKVQMPAGMTCSGTVGGAKNVCIVRMKNAALAGPFGGSAAFTNPDASSASTGTSTSSESTASAVAGAGSVQSASVSNGSDSTSTESSASPENSVSTSSNGDGQSTSITQSGSGNGQDSSTIVQSNGGKTTTTQSNSPNVVATNNRKRGLEFCA